MSEDSTRETTDAGGVPVKANERPKHGPRRIPQRLVHDLHRTSSQIQAGPGL